MSIRIVLCKITLSEYLKVFKTPGNKQFERIHPQMVHLVFTLASLLLKSSHSGMQQAGDQMAQLTGVSQTSAGTMEQLSTIFHKLQILKQFK